VADPNRKYFALLSQLPLTKLRLLRFSRKFRGNFARLLEWWGMR